MAQAARRSIEGRGEFLSPDSRFEVRVTRDTRDVAAAQALRYHVFCEEMAARPRPAMVQTRRDVDEFDDVCDHLIVRDLTHPQGSRVVATTRMLRQRVAAAHGGFYSAKEFDIRPLLRGDPEAGEICEIGRSSVHPDYRGTRIIQLLWRGLAQYYRSKGIARVMGCASLPGADPEAHALALSYLYHWHLAPVWRRARAWPEHRSPMNRLGKGAIDEARAFRLLPPLIKGYLRLGAVVGDGAVVDHQFQTTDVFMAVELANAPRRYHAFFERDRAQGAKAAAARKAHNSGDSV